MSNTKLKDAIIECGELDDGEYCIIKSDEWNGLCFLVQRLSGLLIVILASIVAVVIGDVTGPFVCILIGLWLMFTRKKALFHSYGGWCNGDF